MRIIAGQCGGAQLYAPRGMDTRPTQDKVKESLFSIIQAYVPGARVLDLFAGSGALALEGAQPGRGLCRPGGPRLGSGLVHSPEWGKAALHGRDADLRGATGGRRFRR